MEFKKKMTMRLILAVFYLIFGIALIIVNLMGMASSDFISGLGAVFAVMGTGKIVQCLRIMRSRESLREREIRETDERSVMIYTKARSLTFTIYIIAAAVAVIVLHLLNLEFAEQIVAYTLCGFVFIYWVSYFIISRKY